MRTPVVPRPVLFAAEGLHAHAHALMRLAHQLG
jgi:hypothetical protein